MVICSCAAHLDVYLNVSRFAIDLKVTLSISSKPYDEVLPNRWQHQLINAKAGALRNFLSSLDPIA